jgi:cytochrome bd ubiquinol oxidase subunit II
MDEQGYHGTLFTLLNPCGYIPILCKDIFIEKPVCRSIFSSCILIVTVTFTGIIGLYPNLVPSNIDPQSCMTIFNFSSSPYTLKIMTIVVMLFVPVVIAYQIWMYRIFRHRVSPTEILQDEESY